jgi:hypothetical protein
MYEYDYNPLTGQWEWHYPYECANQCSKHSIVNNTSQANNFSSASQNQGSSSNSSFDDAAFAIALVIAVIVGIIYVAVLILVKIIWLIGYPGELLMAKMDFANPDTKVLFLYLPIPAVVIAASLGYGIWSETEQKDKGYAICGNLFNTLVPLCGYLSYFAILHKWDSFAIWFAPSCAGIFIGFIAFGVGIQCFDKKVNKKLYLKAFQFTAMTIIGLIICCSQAHIFAKHPELLVPNSRIEKGK